MFVVKDAKEGLCVPWHEPRLTVSCASIQFDEQDAKAAEQQGHHVSCC